jgi:hypothetical protein
MKIELAYGAKLSFQTRKALNQEAENVFLNVCILFLTVLYWLKINESNFKMLSS